ncbi:SDR family oxidoreductase [Piscirickettsia salmonis]|uniref:SDR family NAD(P)-dependent oxidoreductase n=1 Tax=Piscirickettsia salmonis TaxID=1238 RepID=UPI0012B807F8
MLEFLSHNCKEKASFFLIVFFNLLIVCQKLLIERYKGSSVLYGATKGAIATITKSLAIDFASSNIRVNSVCPGTIETPLYHNAVKSNSHKLNMTNDDLYNILKTSQPIQRVGLPEEVSNVIYFLNSGEASFVTGSLYSVDGGYTAQ